MALIKAIGITATHKGISDHQRLQLTETLTLALDLGYTEFRHGDCIGGDAEGHTIAMDLGYNVVIHPPSDPKRRAFCKGHVILPPQPYIKRDHAMVDAIEFLVGCPFDTEILRSGTWATIRYARKRIASGVRLELQVLKRFK